VTTDLSYPHIEKATGEPARLKRHSRIRVAQIVMDYLAYGWSPDEMCRQHPYVTQSEVHAAMTYYFDHQDEIEAEIRLEAEEAEEARSAMTRSPFYTRLKAKGLL